MKIIIPIIAVTLVTAGIFAVIKMRPRDFSLNSSTSPSAVPSGVSPTPSPTELPSVVSVIMKTAKGNITLELYSKVAPKTVANFVKLASTGFYDGTKFHRVEPNFVIQGGDPLSKTDDPNVGRGGPGYIFEDEINPNALGLPGAEIAQLEQAGYRYNPSLSSIPVKTGTIAMANAGPNTNGSQFFIVIGPDQSHLNGRHTVFGKVISGMDVALKIKQGDAINKIEIKN